MIEWWLALIIAILPIGGGGLGWFLNSNLALRMQNQQHKFDESMQKQRLDAEREARSAEARRAELKKRLEPVYDALLVTEQLLNHQLWLHAIASSGAEAAAQAVAAELLPDGVPPELVENALEQIRKGEGPEEVRPQDVIVKLFAASARVGDTDLLNSLIALVGMVAGGDINIGDAYIQVSRAYEHLETYISRPV